ncbi:MAG: PAS domain S-box protein [Arcobacteraceae bacterium]|jgi:PAS domain S-box-containing protein|nr:PAS domain S-box protein [Arcobacteraceae bacterium]
MALKLEDLKEALDCISEAVVVSDIMGKMVLINKATIEKLKLDKSDENQSNILDFIPKTELWKLENARERADSEYYEIVLRRKNGETFTAIVSGRNIVIGEEAYRISTILDVTSLKETEEKLLANTKEQLKNLKNHIITKVSKNAQDTNDLKAKQNEELHKYSLDLEHYAKQNKDFEKIIFNLKTKVIKLDKMNEELRAEIVKVQKDAFSFKDLLELQINKAKMTGERFSLILVTIDNFVELLNTFEHKSKMDTIITATTRYLKTMLRNFDVIQYVNDGMFYIIVINTPNLNVTLLSENLSKSKALLDGMQLQFTAGMSFFYKHDSVEQITYRCMKDHNEHLKIKKDLENNG